MDPSTQFAVVASREAWADSGITEIDHDRLAVAFATGIGGVWTLLDAWDTLREKGPRRVLPMTVPMLMPNGPAAAVSLDLGARAGAHTPVSACASGTEAVHMGLDLIRSGKADVVVCGGAEAAIHPMPIAAFASMQALSRRNDDPEHASRPYDRRPRRLRHGRRRRCPGARSRGARPGPRRPDLRRTGRHLGHGRRATTSRPRTPRASAPPAH